MNPLRPVCLLALGAFLCMGGAVAAEESKPVTSQASSPQEGLTRYDFSGPGMFTTFRISCYAADRGTAEKAVEACFARIAELNHIFTDYDPTSELMRLCAPDAKYPVMVSPPMRDLLARSIEIAEDTEGTYDVTCGHLTQLWRRARRQGKLPPQARLQAGIKATDWRRVQVDISKSQVTLKPGTLLDLGGIAKGYAADECLRLLRQHGLPRAVAIAGGDTAVGDAPPGKKGWEVKLRTFTKAAEEDELKTLILANKAVSTSGDLYQFIEIEGQRYSHILSPKTGLGLTERIACSVIADDCTTSDGIATAMCVMGVERGKEWARQRPNIEVQFSTPEGE